MAMLYMPMPFPSRDLDAWFRTEARGDKDRSLYVLSQLHIITMQQESKNNATYELYKAFARSLRQALEGSGTHRSFGVPSSKPDPNKVSISFLDEYARKQWESILFYMVGSTVGLAMADIDVAKGTKKLLSDGGYVHFSHGKVQITSAGFAFVLKETNAQVWSLLVAYLRAASTLGMSEVDVLSFLFMLGSLELGQDYSTSTLSATQHQMLEDLADMGIVYRSSKNASTFYPTRLATTLTSDAGALSTTNDPTPTAAQKGFIIVETNYRLYAYTNSLLQIAVLSLFCKLTTRFPNLVCGKLTKESVTRAVKHGITADQIISYLSVHAHPQMQKKNPPLPPTVTDQIQLWKKEDERMETEAGFLMKEFGTDREYRDTVEYAKSLGVLRWKNDDRRMFFVTKIDQIGKYLETYKKGGG
ncbi:transcription factor Tfb2 [Corynespora cassiicola Philippines]|uniref:RNA polymerase II transcription factor B subunit 2 n=1 Tax=Corynespora cassiicola Philippines TaxID=1448308 RepID=A0A2T2NPG7_CORCC|nr:transcription factor Tfb2 [Corynespora cassiicola Philippines]